MNEESATTKNKNKNKQTEAERLLGIAEKLLESRDLSGSREFALLAQETHPDLLPASDQILAITDVLLASERRVNSNRLHFDWYAILQTHPTSDLPLLNKNYRHLAALLNPDNNKYPFADSAFKLVSHAWEAVNSSSSSKSLNKAATDDDDDDVMRKGSFWTACPYCYVIYEYEKRYVECCLRCQNCERGFHASSIPNLPPIVPGKQGYYCCWGFFPLGYNAKEVALSINHNTNINTNTATSSSIPNMGFPNWMPGMFISPMSATPGVANTRTDKNNKPKSGGDAGDIANNNNNKAPQGQGQGPGPKKPGRPRKNPPPPPPS